MGETLLSSIQMVKRLGIAFFAFSICRLLFYIFNSSHFPEASWFEFLYGLRFDASAIGWAYLPFILVSIIPFGNAFSDTRQRVLKWLFHLSNTICIIFNGIDVEYFKFTLKRSTSDFFQLIQTGNDVGSLIPTFIRDFWYIFLISILLIVCCEWLYRKTKVDLSKSNRYTRYRRISARILNFVISLFIWGILSRGGIQLIPITIIDAGFFIDSKNIPLVLNTPFTFIKTLENQELKPVEFMEPQKAEAIYPFIHKTQFDSVKDLNVIIIVMESFSNEYIGFFNNGKGFTPHLDSILAKSLTFDHCIANGKKSIEGIPAIMAAMPTLMNTPFISSSYSSNKISSIANLLKKEGYHTSFYHGGKNGTMGFEAFCKIVGFDEYKGLNEYPDKEADYDGNWGIFDEEFFSFYVKELSEKKEPFFSSFFSLSSHHPYTIPDKHRGKFPEGNLPILQSVAYADYSLNEFFNNAKQHEWFERTLFVITADHTSELITPKYNNPIGNYLIPLAFYYPANDSVLVGKQERITQQIDIFPSILDWIGYPNTFNSFGQSVFQQNEGYSINYLNNVYQYVEKDFALRFDGQEVIGLYQYPYDLELKKNIQTQYEAKNLELKQKIQAFIQRYNNSLILNEVK